ncbi:MAG: hypothetical protein US03_C0010G0068 [candidate division TM6 bacterium GW2011_GWF2_36_131]|nr:MAG: hypothetical protein US03_C0010G0068 [candidate division TM6 bacterium GW2011_GWF2_36_131]
MEINMKTLNSMSKVFLPVFLLLSIVSIKGMNTPLLGKSEFEMIPMGNGSSTKSSPAESEISVASDAPLLADEVGQEVARALLQDEGFLKKVARKIAACGTCTKEGALALVRSRAFKEIALLTFETGLVAGLSFYAEESKNDAMHVFSSILAKMGADFVSHRKFYEKGIPATLLAGLNTALYLASKPGEWAREFATNMYWAIGTFIGSAAHHDFGVASERIESAEKKQAAEREME